MTNSEQKNCQSCKNDFLIEPDDFTFYETIKVPPPTWCPKCRMKRRMAGQGYRMLHKRKCDFTGDNIISVHPESAPYKVYRQDIWWSDKWDPKEYGRDYDFSKSFFEQFHQLMLEVPMPSLHTEYTTMVNSEYCNAAGTLKNCYLCFKADNSEDCAYLNTIGFMKDCYDTAFSNHCELTYEAVTVNKSSRVFFSQDIEDSHDIWFSRDLVGCSNCIGCINLRGKNYYIFNEPYSKEEYEKKLKELDFGSAEKVEKLQIEVNEFITKFPRKEFHGRKSTDSTGDYIYNCKNVKNSFMVQSGEDSRYCQLLKSGPVAKSYDYTMFAVKAEWIYESAWVGINVNNVKFGYWNYSCHDIEYCFGAMSSGNLFGCVGIRSGEYCILNKQYSKEEYFEMIEKVKKQMAEVSYTDKLGREYRYGEYFPAEHAPWAYNETTIYEWFPKTKKEAEAEGFWWREPDAREYQEATVEIPDHIRDVDDAMLKEILKCTNCGRNYQIIKSELDFLKKFNLPIPRECSLCRDYRRVAQLNPMTLYDRSCAKCSKSIQTSYAPDRAEIIYCEECYQKEVE